MSLKINSFGGPIVWQFRKHFSSFTSKVMLKFVASRRSDITKRYIDWFLSLEKPPLFINVMIETVNRCNGTCGFCPANVNDEKRPYKKMSDDMFFCIIAQLKDIKWNGKLFMCINNEPFIDKRIITFSQYAKKELPNCKIVFITNGTLLTSQILDSMVGVVDQIVINDYSDKYKLSKNHREIYKHIKSKSKDFEAIKISINRRYTREILATRAGTAPNKPKKDFEVSIPCLYPFTDIIIFPDGKTGICCNDCYEVTNFGNVRENSLKEIWEGDNFKEVRKLMVNGRYHPFCKECDVLDAGERETEIIDLMHEKLGYKS